MPGIGIINNPRSKQNRRKPGRIRKLGYILGEKGDSLTTQSMEQIDDCIAKFKKQQIEILGINGGDGSNHIAIDKLIEIYGKTNTPLPMIAFLRGGTLNTIARGFNIFGTPESILHNISNKYGQGEKFNTVQAKLLTINGRHCFIFGNGLIANFMHTYYTTGNPSPAHGVATLFRGIASTFSGTQLAKDWFKKINARVTVDGNELPITQFTAILSATMKEIGVGFQPFYRAFERPDKFHVLFYTCTPLQFARELPYIFMAKPIHDYMGRETLAEKVIIEATEPFHYTQDGEMYTWEGGPLEIGLGPQLTLIIN